MGPGHSSSLHIGGDSSAVPGLGRTNDASDNLNGAALRNAPGSPFFPWTRVRGELMRLNTTGDRNI